jgi:hypothetical protein
MNTTFELTPQELSILISSMQYMTGREEAQSGPPTVVSRLYNKLHTRHEYLLRIQQHYEHDV